jgi:rhamnulokinase
MLGRVGGDQLELREVARFANGPVRRDDGLHWDIDALRSSVLAGLASAVREDPAVASIGIDSWAVDYALLHEGRMLGAPFHYRDERTGQGVERVHALVDPAELYASNGLQFLPFNTVYQLAAEPHLGEAEAMLLIPDLFAFWLTGELVAERTNASTTGLLHVATRAWDEPLIRRLGLPPAIFPPLVDPGTVIGAATEFANVPVTGVSRHRFRGRRCAGHG